MVSNTLPVSTVLQRIAAKVGLKPELIEDAYPCTSLQASLITADLHGVGDYVSTFVFDLSATSYELQDVKNACEHLYDCTPVLRTRFFQSKGKFLQVVTRTSLDWLEYNSLEDYLEQDTGKELQLGDAFARFATIKKSNGNTCMVWSLHHALYDEWSIDLLFKDLSTFVSSATITSDFGKRPKFSRFIKGLSQIDRSTSRTFWKGQLEVLDRYSSLSSNAAVEFETSQQTEHSCSFDLSQSSYQLSTLAIAAWSLILAKLSGSTLVVFGNIVNGRTADIPGIVDICGPTMTTVPYAVDVCQEESMREFLEKLESFRSEMLPYEQTGLDEYRRSRGSGRFDTLLSVRSSQTSTTDENRSKQLRPGVVTGRHVRHPCCFYLDVLIEPTGCTLKASYDERYVERDYALKILSQISRCLETWNEFIDTPVKQFMDSIQLSKLVLPSSNHEPDASSKDSVLAIDDKLLKLVQKVAREITPIQNVGQITSETRLGELGFDSLSNVVLARRLSETLQISVPFRDITGLRKTLSDITRSIQLITQGARVEDSSKLDLLDLAEQYIEDIPHKTAVSDLGDKPDSILLTGATGYVGIMILRQLLISTKDRIILLVRCESSKEGIDRIRKIAKVARWNLHEIKLLDHRVQIWSSDLGASDLGLTTQQLTQFKDIRTIIHNGAQVNFSLDYHDLEGTNVSATAFLLRHYLSSQSVPSFVYLTGGRSCPLDLEETLETTASKLAAANGYAQSKFVSEVLLHRAQEVCRENKQETQMTIIHPGIVIGNEREGVANTDDFIWRYVAASIRMRAYVPAVPTKREWINLMTVDSVALEAVSAATNKHKTEEVNRRLMRSGLSVARFWEVIIETLDLESVLEPVSEWEWLRRLQDELSRKGVKHPLFSLSQMLLQGFLKGIGGVGPRPENEPSDEDMMVSEKAVAANALYLEGVGFFMRDEGDALDVEVFGRSRH